MTNFSEHKLISMMRALGVARSAEEDMAGLHGIKFLKAMNRNFWYGPYSAGDFTVKSKLMVAVLLNYKFYNGEFLNKEQFISKHFSGKRTAGEKAFNNISENLYGAIKIGDKGQITTSEDYEKALTPQLLANISSILATLSRKVDGTLTGTEKSKAHENIFGAALLMHRGWLINAIQERFHPRIFSYEKQAMIAGIYRDKETYTDGFKVLIGFIKAKIADISDGTFKKSNRHSNEAIDEMSGSGIYNSKRMFHELKWMMILSMLTTLLGRLVPLGDDDNKDDKAWQMWPYIISLRLTMEMYALYSPVDTYSIVGDPVAAGRGFDNLINLFSFFFSDEGSELVGSGRYQYKTKTVRALIKATPGVKGVYENLVSPDLSAQEKYMMSNLPIKLSKLDILKYGSIVNYGLDPYTERERIKKQKAQDAIRRRKERAERKKANIEAYKNR
jgi:hypothetical protein